MDISEGDREAALALVKATLRDAGRTTPPPETEQGDWLRGTAEWSDPDANGWVTLTPVEIPVWVPKALVGWQVALETDGPLNSKWLEFPNMSLKRWPEIEAAVRCLYAAAEH